MVAGRVEFRCRGAATASLFEWHSVVNEVNQERFISCFHFAATANLITTRDVFERVGAFNPALYSGGDFEWGRRAWSIGVAQRYAEDAVVQHLAAYTDPGDDPVEELAEDYVETGETSALEEAPQPPGDSDDPGDGAVGG